ncbi:unnamed protein product [Effrenium voratum]|nr:unnamed protein product [Effrenium voratum]
MEVGLKPIWAEPRQPKDHTPELCLPKAPTPDSGTEVESAGEDIEQVPSSGPASARLPGAVEDAKDATSQKPNQPDAGRAGVSFSDDTEGGKGANEEGAGESSVRKSAYFTEFRTKLKRQASVSTRQSFWNRGAGQVANTFSRGSTAARSSIFRTKEDEVQPQGPRAWLAQKVSSPAFEFTFAIIIFLNTMFMAVQVQYRGLNVGYTLNYPSVQLPAEESWPHAEQVFLGVEICFGVIFTCEILVKIVGLDINFCCDPWNILDFCVVLAWFVDTLAQGWLPVDPLMLRLLRLVKLLRMLRLVRTIQGFDSLYVMITSIRGSVAALFWSVMLLILVLMTVSLFLVVMMEPYITSNEEEERRSEVYKYYGTFSKAMLSLFEMTLANWPTPSRVLTENVSEAWIFFILSFQLLVGFSVMKVIMGVFLQITFYVASNDDVIMMSQKERALKVHTKKMTALFEAADENGNGRLDETEFADILQDPACLAWLSAMGLEASMLSGKDLYRLLCVEGTNDLSAEELCKGVAELKGSATSLNMALLQRDQCSIKELMDSMCMSLVKLQGRLKWSEHKNEDSSTSSSSSDAESLSEAATQKSQSTLSRSGTRERRKSLQAWMQNRTARGRTVVSKRATQGAVSHALFNKDEEEDIQSQDSRRTKLQRQLKRMVLSSPFEAVFGALICANTIVMAFQTEYDGLNTGYNQGFDGLDLPANEIWPGAETAFVVSEYFFGILFTLEILTKIGCLYHHFFKDPWNLMDFAVVVVWLMETMTGSEDFPVQPMILRLFRLIKLTRVVRLVRILEKYDALYLMIASIRGSVAALAWSTILLLVVQTMLALVITTLLEAYFLNDDWKGDKLEVFKYYGTFSRALLTMFEITLANFIPVTRSMINNVSQAYFIFGMLHKFFIGLAVVMVITGVFIQETMKVAQTDNNIMLSQRERSNRLHTRKMKTLFAVADLDGSGRLELEEFERICQDESMKMWLSAMGLDVSDATAVFKLICEQLDGENLSARELVNGVSRLKGPARNIDMALLRQENAEILKRVNKMQATLNEIGENIEVDL